MEEPGSPVTIIIGTNSSEASDEALRSVFITKWPAKKRSQSGDGRGHASYSELVSGKDSRAVIVLPFQRLWIATVPPFG